MIIRAKSYPRAGLVGNPSDGYFGKTISFAFGNFCAEVAYREELSEVSDTFHNNIRERFELGDKKVVNAMGLLVAIDGQCQGGVGGGQARAIGTAAGFEFQQTFSYLPYQ